MRITYLIAPMPLTKSYTKKDGVITKSSYPMAYEFSSATEDMPDLASFARSITKHAALGHCLLKGEITKELKHESRAGSTDSNLATDWICLDVDGIPNCTAAEFMQHIKLDNVSHIVQYSASYMVENKDLKCHIFINIDPLSAPIIKQWLIQLNHSTPILRSAMSLTKTGNSLRWPLDITASQNDKLLYITPPLMKGMKDTVKDRIILINGTTHKLSIPKTNNAAQNRELTDKRIAELRAAEGYPTRKIAMKMHGSTEVMIKPDACTLSNIKKDRGFVYFNLNGGDSWGYYHPEDNPEFIHNFKGEPSYLTKELLPDYWKELQESSSATRSDGTTYLAFTDKQTGQYWRGTHDAATDVLDIYPAKNETQMRHFAKQHGMPLGDYIPEWDLCFDPMDSVRVDPVNRSVNTFQPTIYMMKLPDKKIKTCPKLCLRLFHHVCGGDMAITEHWINWLAYIIQYRTRTCTSWVLHGRTGTGKGALFHKILRPLFGLNQTVIRNMEALNEQYNDYMEKSLIIFVDEVDAKALINEQGVMAKMRSYITEEKVPVRAMYQGQREIQNYSNWILSSNQSTPVSITKDDRRTNVAKFQKQPLLEVMTSEEIDQLEDELQALHDYLVQYKVDLKAVSTPIQTEDRSTLMSISEASVDTVGSALIAGDLPYFINSLPTSDAYKNIAKLFNEVESYKDVLVAIIERTTPDGKCVVTRDELFILFNYTIGNMPTSPNKFTSLLKHHRIHTEKVWVERAVMGLKVTWAHPEKLAEYLLEIHPPPVIKPVKLKAVK
jgi:hypothetical protein